MYWKNKKGSCAILFVVMLAFIFAGMATLALYFNSLPPISELKNYQPTLLSQVVSSDGAVIKTFGSYKYSKVTINEVPDNLKKAIIATEDKNFYRHRGFDVIALVRSTISNIAARRVVQGASTITQQLARILFLSTEKTLDRKIKELIIAYRLEKTLPKDEILTMYLNNVYLGEGAYGIAAASEIYFNKKVSQLTLPEAALIAGMPQAPSLYSPYQNMKLAKERRSQVLTRMQKMGFITEAQAEKANNSPIIINSTHRPYSLNKAPYFLDYVMKELREKVGITEQEVIQGGYKIYTTLNYNYQKAAQDAVQQNMAKWGLKKPQQQAALLSLDVVTGKILAYVGGKDYSVSQFDRVSLAVRQPGSSFKMFVYAAAMEKGLNPMSIYNDAPVSIGNWSPRNYAGKYRGRIPLYKALAVSSNSVAVQLIRDVGVGSVIDIAKRLGISTPMASDPTIALGSSGVKLLEMTTAYGVLANGGVKVQPYAIDRIETSNGRVIYQATSTYKRAIDTKTVAYTVEMLKKVVEQGTGRAANIGRPVAGKTGTTDNYKDAWFVAFTPEVVTGVWAGNDNNASTPNLTGGTLPAIIWAQFMKVVEANKPVLQFTYPEIVLDEEYKPYSTDLPDENVIVDEESEQSKSVEAPVPTDNDQTSTDQQQDSATPPTPTNPVGPPLPDIQYNRKENRPNAGPVPDAAPSYGNTGF